jgi:hypothetical protein
MGLRDYIPIEYKSFSFDLVVNYLITLQFGLEFHMPKLVQGQLGRK